MEHKEDKKLNIKDLEKKFIECEKKRDEYLTGWQRARADYLNNKKNEAERAGNLIFFAQSEIILEIISVLDNFEKAEQEIQKFLDDDSCVGFENFYNGFTQIKKQMREILKNYEIEEIKTIGEKFSPDFAEAIEEIKEEDKDAGIIVEEIEKGYKFKDKIIRPAKVKVAK
ncbi:MAG: nucleotide exchange factor GrpE [Patescibacteria group bacterium]|nr:nucleotide exchange factor GrpE [Patescibacteria group bacterium]